MEKLNFFRDLQLILLFFILIVFGGCVTILDKSNLNASNEINKVYLSSYIYKTLNKDDWVNLIENKKLEGKEVIILDVRTKKEYDEGNIPNSINLDFYSSNFKNELNNLDKDKVYFIYCRSGSRSEKTLNIMKELKFKEVYNLDGGYLSWSK
jgi:rhodanese-related sulfurtransferase